MVDIGAIGSSVLQQQIIERSGDKLQKVISGLLSGRRLNKASDDVAALSLAAQLQSQVSGLKQVSTNLARAVSLTQVADGGLEQVQTGLQQLQALASQAQNSSLSAEAREQLNVQFQQLATEIDRIARDTSFNNRPLLDGSLTSDNTISLESILSPTGTSEDGGGTALVIGDVSTDRLFNGESLSLSSVDGATQAFAVVGEALKTVVGERTRVGAFQQAVGFLAANVDSAVINQQAAQAVLQDTDFAEASTQFSLADIQRKASIAIAAQGNNLRPNLLSLIS